MSLSHQHPAATRALASRVALLLMSLIVVGSWRGAVAEVTPEAPVDEINNDRGFALRGFDPVAYFTDAHAVSGKPTIQLVWNGATCRFATVDHLKLFAADPTPRSSVAIERSLFP